MGEQRRWAGGTGRAAILMLLVGLAACSKSATNAGTTPSQIPPTTVVTATVTTTATASPSPRVSSSRSPSPRVSVSVTATPSVTPTAEVSNPSGGTTTIKAGQYLSLRLSQGSDPADQWVFTTSPDASVLTVVSDQTISGGVHKWVFQGKAAGTTSFTVVEHGPGTPPPNIFTFSQTVVVTP